MVVAAPSAGGRKAAKLPGTGKGSTLQSAPAASEDEDPEWMVQSVRVGQSVSMAQEGAHKGGLDLSISPRVFSSKKGAARSQIHVHEVSFSQRVWVLPRE